MKPREKKDWEKQNERAGQGWCPEASYVCIRDSTGNKETKDRNSGRKMSQCDRGGCCCVLWLRPGLHSPVLACVWSPGSSARIWCLSSGCPCLLRLWNPDGATWRWNGALQRVHLLPLKTSGWRSLLIVFHPGSFPQNAFLISWAQPSPCVPYMDSFFLLKNKTNQNLKPNIFILNSKEHKCLSDFFWDKVWLCSRSWL